MAVEITLRSVKGSALTHNEMDTNLTNLKEAIDVVSTGLINYIGEPGTAGFGVGICPPGQLPAEMSPMPSFFEVTADNYGNYIYQDGSVMVWIPKFWYKVGTGSNGLAVNVIDVAGIGDYDSTTEANAAGYALHRAFIDGDEEKDGFFVDKYMCSKLAWGSGYIASSIQNGLPLSIHADHNPIADLTACSVNQAYEIVTAAHARDGIDGAVNSSSRFFCCSKFIYSALAILSIAHGQAASATTYCAWYDSGGTTNYPKGCNDNALGDTDDGTISYTSDGYSNCGKTGSGTPFAKTTHNGQTCGVTDLNGLLHEISLGFTCITSAKTISAATKANPCQITTSTTHGRSTGDYIQITSVGGMTELNNKIYVITVVDTSNFTLDNVDSTGFTTYTSGGTATFGDFYVAKEATAMKDFTSGDSGATDHWGATGVAAMMDSITPAFEVTYPDNEYVQRMGDGSGQVFSEATSGDNWILTGLGLPKDTGGISTTGTNLFGTDYYYQKIVNDMCMTSCGYYANMTNAGILNVVFLYYRTVSSFFTGFRLACYGG